MKKHRSSGKKYYASESANLGDLLRQAGYNFDAPDFVSTDRAATDVNTSSNMESDGLDNVGDRQGVIDPLEAGNLTGAGLSAVGGALIDATGKFIRDPNLDIATGISEAVNPYTNNTSLAQKGLTAGLDAGTMGANALFRAAGLDVAGTIGNVLGIGGPSSRYAKDIAQQQAYADLQNKIRGALTSSGFENRIGVQDNEQTLSRAEGLRALLANMDKTNR
jgi:hypothetical protein